MTKSLRTMRLLRREEEAGAAINVRRARRDCTTYLQRSQSARGSPFSNCASHVEIGSAVCTAITSTFSRPRRP
ncbi:hypothetical protein BST61_g2982 [Cercospora zeina]